ncbi:MAG TPA: hypothetical protein VFT29_15160 [Gemmatimonadaceae bacterium]|nr:hypothetical protein [Gemmatimonadaceae bacterium]
MLSHVPVIGVAFAVLVLAASLALRNSAMGKLGLLILVGLGVATAIVYFTGEAAEEAVEKLSGVSESIIHEHEEVAEVSFAAMGVGAVLALGALWWYRRRDLARWATMASLCVALVITGMMAWTANLGGQVRHTEIRATAGVVDEAREDSDDR